MFEKLVAREVALNEALQTICIDVYITYQGTTRKSFSYIVPQNQEEYEDPEYMFDDAENKSGFVHVCNFINTKMSQFFEGRELPLSKKVFDQLANWVDRQHRQRNNAQVMA